jgi:hypothetical protein
MLKTKEIIPNVVKVKNGKPLMTKLCNSTPSIIILALRYSQSSKEYNQSVKNNAFSVLMFSSSS